MLHVSRDAIEAGVHPLVHNPALEAELAETRRRLAAAEAKLPERAGDPHRSATQLAKTLDLIPQMVWSTLPDGHHDYFSKLWYNFTGVPEGSTDGDAWKLLFHPDDQELTDRLWAHSLATGEPYEIRYRLRHHSGDYRWLLGRAWPERDENGAIVRWYGTCTDIHEQLEAEQELARSEKRFRDILGSLPSVVWSTQADGTHDYCNDKWEEFAGRQLNELEQNGWLKLVHADDLDQLTVRWQHSLDTGAPFDATFRFLHSSGEYRWVCSRGLPQRDEGGRIIRWYGTCLDIHDRMLTEQALRASQALNSSILDSSPDCIKLLEADGTILYINPLGPQSLGFEDAKPLIGACWFDLLAPDVAERARAAVGAAAEGAFEQLTVMQPALDGTPKWFDIIITRVAGGEGGRALVIARDITTQHESEQALRDSEVLHRSILEASGDCIKVMSTDGRLELMNRPGLRAMEIQDFEAIRGKDWVALWPEAARKTVAVAVAEASAGRAARFTDFCPTARGTPKWWDVVVTPMLDEQGEVVRLLSISRDITATREAADQLRWTSEHDALTDLPNRRTFQAHLQAATLRAMESGGMIGLLLLDLDHFKHVNDTLGHSAGDHLLKTFAQRLKSCVRGGDLVARLGGDEFAVIIEGVKAQDDLLRAGESILERLQAPIVYDGRVVSAGASIGGALFPNDAATANELFKNADTALYALKSSGRGGTRMFHNYMREEAQRVASQLSLARVAISERSVVPYYQQKVDLRTGRIRGFEALLRWQHPTRGIQLPDTVAEAFKDYELASKIGELMQAKVFGDMCAWQRSNIPFGRISINAAPAEFLRDDYAERLLTRLEEFGLPGSLIEVEVTEHVFIERGSEYVSRALKLLTESGVKVSLDDFGTGYSSLSHLRDFPVDVVKIDRSFIARIAEEPEIAAIVSAVIDLAASLCIDVVAEGIETEAQAAMLRNGGCGLGQGFLFGRAAVADEVPLLLGRALG